MSPTSPMTPPDCNLQDFPRMMIHIGRLRGSAFDAQIDSEAWRAGVNLWMESWHQEPAGSLEAKEEVLVKGAGLGRDVKTWRRIRDGAMHGWILCDDGRYYHPVVAETVLECWLNKLLKRLSSGHGNARRHRYDYDPAPVIADIRTAATMLERLDPKAEVLKKPAIQKARQGLPVDLPVGEENEALGRNSRALGSQGKGREGNLPPKPPRGGSVQIAEWQGPAEVRDIIRAQLGQDADGYLLSFTWRDVPEKSLVTGSPTMLAKLKPCASALADRGWALVLEKRASA